MYDPTTLMGLSDHVFVMTTIATPYLTNRRQTRTHTPQHSTIYKWNEGTNISNYGKSAQIWTAHTQEATFIEGMQTIIQDTNLNNNRRATAMEEYIIKEAIDIGVVKEIKISHPKNPNKWGKTLAPWFNDECREAKKRLAQAKRTYDKGNANIIQATREFHKVCLKRRSEFASETPDMLKY